MPDCPRLLTQRGLLEIAHDELKVNNDGTEHRYTNAIRRAEEFLTKADAMKPGGEDHLHRLAVIAYVYKNEVDKAVKLWQEAITINPSKWGEFISYIGAARAGQRLPPPARAPDGPPLKNTGVRMISVPQLAKLSATMKGK